MKKTLLAGTGTLVNAICFATVLLLGNTNLVAAPVEDTPGPLPQGITRDKPNGPSVEVDGKYMIPYTLTIPGTTVTIDMVPIPGGTVQLGSPEDEEGRNEDEGPTVAVEVGPMWVAKTEVTWKQYKVYMSMYQLFKSMEERGIRKVSEENTVDAVTAPTELYDPSFTFKFGEDPELPATTMTQFAAKQFTKWLSKLSGHQYRLPTEAEWEFACSGGQNSAYHFGDDAESLRDYAWYVENSDEKPHVVGQLKPNQYGLFDMHGNVMEWVIDGYTEEGYETLAEKTNVKALDSIRWPESFDNRVVRGGSWQDEPEMLRSAARVASEDEDWKAEDPNVPLSPWWYTDDPARGIGFRLFRSYDPVDEKTIAKFWNIDNEDIEFDVDMRLTEGRGAQSLVDKKLAEEISNARK